MTILDLLNNKGGSNKLLSKALDVIKDNYTNWVNDNYELTINEKNELVVKIPSLEKRNEYVYKNIGEYEYPLVMCMRISEMRNDENYEYVLVKFMELYKDKLELFLKDITTVNKLVDKIKNTKSNIDYICYGSIIALILGAISLCIFTNIAQTTKYILIAGMIICFFLAIVMQLTKEYQIKKVVNGYLSIIKTEWYQKQLTKEYSFMCSLI